jgi:hypothetical protein
VSLIDFDSFYHPSLPMPAATTCGSAGYIPPFAWNAGGANPRATWCTHSDRFALAALNAEFLLLTKGSPLTAEGGMLCQDELNARNGKKLERALKALAAEYLDAAALFEAAIRSRCPDDCPSSEDWERFCDRAACVVVKPPTLDQLEEVSFGNLAAARRSCAVTVPAWQVPRLSELPPANYGVQLPCMHPVELPADPWATRQRRRGIKALAARLFGMLR